MYFVSDKIFHSVIGFLYMSPFIHKFLTATQYVAPLMANFDTMTGGENSSVLFKQVGKRHFLYSFFYHDINMWRCLVFLCRFSVYESVFASVADSYSVHCALDGEFRYTNRKYFGGCLSVVWWVWRMYLAIVTPLVTKFCCVCG